MTAVIKYGEDFYELKEALEKLGEDVIPALTEEHILKARRIVLPSAQNTKTAVRKMHLTNIFQLLQITNKPVLGIGGGMEMMCNFSRQKKNCLGLFGIDAQHLSEELTGESFHTLKRLNGTRLMQNIDEEDKFYFDSIIDLDVIDPTTFVISGGNKISAVIEKDNYYAVQFHPEKSGEAGLKVLSNFLNL